MALDVAFSGVRERHLRVRLVAPVTGGEGQDDRANPGPRATARHGIFMFRWCLAGLVAAAVAGWRRVLAMVRLGPGMGQRARLLRACMGLQFEELGESCDMPGARPLVLWWKQALK